MANQLHLSPYHRMIRDNLKTIYNINTITFKGAGKHDKALFEYNGKQMVLIVNKNSEVNNSTRERNLRDLKRILKGEI